MHKKALETIEYEILHSPDNIEVELQGRRS